MLMMMTMMMVMMMMDTTQLYNKPIHVYLWILIQIEQNTWLDSNLQLEYNY